MKKTRIFIVIVDFIILIAMIYYLATNDVGKYYVEMKEEIKNSKIVNEPVALNNIEKDIYIKTNNYKKSDNKYEEEIINHEYDEVYKLIDLEIDGFPSYLVVVYNPANVKLMLCNGFRTPDNSGKINVISMVKKYNALAGINGGGFYDNGVKTTDVPLGYIINDGKLVWKTSNRPAELIGFNYDNELKLITATGEDAINQGMRDALEFGPFLIVDGETTEEAKKLYSRNASRVVLAQREDKIVLMLVTNGGTLLGPNMENIIKTLQNYGAVNAANLDGGASAQLVLGNKMYNTAYSLYGQLVKNGRPVVNGWGIFKGN